MRMFSGRKHPHCNNIPIAITYPLQYRIPVNKRSNCDL
jgi:hypothetical protein